MKRYVFAGAAVAELDKQGVIVPPDLPARGVRKDVVVAGVHHIEIWDRSHWATMEHDRRSVGMLPNVQRTDAADHVPVLADEVREFLAVQPGETIVTRPSGQGVIRGCLQRISRAAASSSRSTAIPRCGPTSTV